MDRWRKTIANRLSKPYSSGYSLVSYMEDGKFISSNGNLASYISSLDLLEKMTNHQHKKFVETYLYLDRLKQWAE